METSGQVYVRHNQVYENGGYSQDKEEIYKFGLWLEGLNQYLVRCPIQVTDDIKGKRLLAILHTNPIGSQYFLI